MSFEGDARSSHLGIVPDIQEDDSALIDTPPVGASFARLQHPISSQYQRILDDNGWKVTSDCTTNTSAQPLIARIVARVIDSGVPLPDIQVGDHEISPFGENRKICLGPIKDAVVKAFVTEKKRELTILIPGITLLSLGNRMVDGPYNLSDFFQSLFANALRGDLIDEYGLDLAVRFNIGGIVGTSDRIAIFPYYFSVTLINTRPPSLKVV